MIYEMCRMIRKIHNLSTFICVVHSDATEDALFRERCFSNKQEANMVTHDAAAIVHVLSLIKNILQQEGRLLCFYCSTRGFTEDSLWDHGTLYHVNDPNVPVGSKCPCCSFVTTDYYPLQVHYRNCHGPCGRGEVKPEEDYTGIFGLVVCRRPSDGKFLMVQEFSQSGFWFPGGQLNKDETIWDGALRETMEEAGMKVILKGVLKVGEHDDGGRRIIFYAEPENEKDLPKTIPDYESVGAVWVDVDDLKILKLRNDEPKRWFPHVAKGKEIHPLSFLNQYQEKWNDVKVFPDGV